MVEGGGGDKQMKITDVKTWVAASRPASAENTSSS